MTGKSPLNVFSDEGRGMVRACTQRSDYFGRGGRVSQAHREVAQPPLVADAPDRRAAKALVELALSPGEELDQRRVVEPVPRLEILFAARLREAVPGAHQLAVVAAVHAVADERPQLFRDGALVLDGEVGDAATRIELVRPADRLRRTHVDAALAGSASIDFLFVDREGKIAKDLAQEKPRACLSVKQQRVLAAPADAGFLRELHLEHRRRVGEHAMAESANLGFDALAKLLQPAAQDLVIVPAAGIARDVGIPGF